MPSTMLSLAHRCTTYINPSPTSTLALLGRCLSLTHRRPEARSPLSATKLVKDAENKTDRNQARRLRYASDPEYRAKIVAQSLACYRR
jgi:hypothetical protein